MSRWELLAGGVAACLGLGALTASDASAQTRAVTASSPKFHHAGKTTIADPQLVASLRAALSVSHRALLAEVFDRVTRKPAEQDQVLAGALAVAPQLRNELNRAAEIGALVAAQRPGLAAAPQAVVSTTVSVQGPGLLTSATSPVLRSANFPSFTPPLTDRPDQWWMASRPALPGTWTANQIKEFNANWGNLAVGQQTALANNITGAGVVVGVIDSGIAATFNANRTGFTFIHSEFTGRLDLRSGTPLNDGTISTNLLDTNGHGTHVAGTIAAAQDGSGMVGIAPGATILALAAIGVPGGSDAAGMSYLADQADVRVINGSYGPEVPRNATIWNANNAVGDFNDVKKALDAGKILVFANGNDGQNAPVQAANPSGISLYPFIRPANANSGVYTGIGNTDFSAIDRSPGQIIAVSNVGVDLSIAGSSNRCGVTASWCLSAPGGGDDATGPNGILSTYINKDSPVTLSGSLYAYSNGTSMAAPHVSGVVADLIQAYPTYSARDIVAVMFATAQDLGAPGVDAIYGYGLVRLDRALAGPTTLASGANVTVVANDTTYWSQPLANTGGFTKDGTGNLIIAGRTAVTDGNVGISQGALGVGGTLTVTGTVGGNAARLQIDQTAMLAGFGTVNAISNIQGTLSPGALPNLADAQAFAAAFGQPAPTANGTSIGTLTFTKSVTLAATANTRIGIDGTLEIPGGPRTYSKIVISGAGSSFNLGGTLTPVLRDIPGATNTYTPVIGDKFKFLTATDGATITGQFGTMVQPAAGLAAGQRLVLLTTPTSLTLDVAPTSFNTFVQTQNANPNTGGVAGALDAANAGGGGNTARGAAIFNALYNEDSDELDDGLTTLSGQGHTATPRAVLMSFSGLAGVIGDRQNAVMNGGGGVQGGLMPAFAMAYGSEGPTIAASAAAVPFPVSGPSGGAGRWSMSGQWSTWGQVYGQWSRVGSRGDLPGSSTSGGGFVVGVDRMFLPDLMGGVAFGFARSSTTSDSTKTRNDTYAASLYSSWMPGRLVVDSRVAVGPTKGSSMRSIDLPGVSTIAAGDTSGFGALAATEVGYRVFIKDVMLKPYVGISAQTFRRNEFTETTDFGLTFPSQTFNKVTGSIGIVAHTQKTLPSGLTLMPVVKLAFARDFRDDSFVTNVALLDEPFQTHAATPGRDAFVGSLGLMGWQTERLRVFTNYSGEFRANGQAHQLTGGLRSMW